MVVVIENDLLFAVGMAIFTLLGITFMYLFAKVISIYVTYCPFTIPFIICYYH